MKRKPIKLDWEQLEDAFTSKNEDLVYYLDLVTGHLVLEGEGQDAADEEDLFGGGIPTARQPPQDDSMRAYVKPPDVALKIQWMKEFIKTSKELESGVAAELEEALEQDEPAAALKETLDRHPEGRDHWYIYRSERVRDLLEAWVKDHEVTPVDPPPWK